MSRFTLLRFDRLELIGDGVRIPVDVAQAVRDAEELSAATQAAAEQMRREGYERGFAQGQTAAADQQAEWLAQALRNEQRHARALVPTLAAAVVAAVRRIVSDEPLAAWMEKAAVTVWEELADARTMTLLVAPAHVEEARQAVTRMRERRAGGIEVCIQADARLVGRQCRLETPLGSADVSLDKQLERLESLLRDDSPSGEAP